MTPEERFTKIENFLSAVAEHQAQMTEHQAHMAEHLLRHDEDIRELREMQKGMAVAITKAFEAHRRTEEVQRMTEQKLNALIETVDRIVRARGDRPS